MKYVTFKYWCLSDFHDTAWYLRARNTHGYPDIMHGLHPTLSWLNNCLIPFLNFFSLQLLLCIVVCVCVAGAGEGGWLAMQHAELPWQGTEPMPPAVEAHSLNHWTIKGVHLNCFLLFLLWFCIPCSRRWRGYSGWWRVQGLKSVCLVLHLDSAT